MFALNSIGRQAIRQLRRPNLMQISSKAKFKDGGEHATMNDLPIPQGSWQEKYKKDNNRYTAVFLSGIIALIGSACFIIGTGKMEMNYTVPDYPYEEEEEA